MNEHLLQQVNTLTSTVDSLNATINAQTQLIAQLNQTIQELKEQLNKNSKNSSNAHYRLWFIYLRHMDKNQIQGKNVCFFNLR